MLSIDITSSFDPNLVGNYLFYKNQLTIGSSHSDDLFIQDKLLLKEHLYLHLEEDKLFITLNEKASYFRLNSKRLKNKKQILRNATFSLEKVEFKVLDFKFEKLPTKNDFLEERKKEIQKNDPQLYNILSQIND